MILSSLSSSHHLLVGHINPLNIVQNVSEIGLNLFSDHDKDPDFIIVAHIDVLLELKPMDEPFGGLGVDGVIKVWLVGEESVI